MGTLLVPKGPRAETVDLEPTVEQMRQTLFTLPLPPPPTGTRTYPTTTALGRIMRLRRLSVNDVAKIDGGPSARQLTDLLAGRRQLAGDHAKALAAGLGVDVRLLTT